MPDGRELVSHVIDVPLFAGMNSSVDSKVMLPGASSLVENGRFFGEGQVQKRYGMTSLPKTTAAGGQVTQGRQVFSAGNSLFLHDGNNVYIQNAINSVWQPIGALAAGNVLSTNLTQTRNSIAELSSAATAQAVVIAWTEAGSVRLAVYDPAGNSFIQSSVVISALGRSPNVVAIGTDFFVTYVDGTAGDLKIVRVPGSDLNHFSNATVVPFFGTRYDVCTNNGLLFVVTDNPSSATGLYIHSFTTNLGLVKTQTYPVGSYLAGTNIWCFSLSPGRVVAGNSTAYVFSDNDSLIVPFPAGPFTGIRRMYGVGTNASNVCWAEALAGSGTASSQVYLVQCSLGAAAGALTNTGVTWFTNQNASLACRPFVVDGTTYVWALSDYKFQTQLAMIDQSGRVVGRALTNGAAGPGDGIYTSIPTVGGTATDFFFAARRRAQLKFDANGNAVTSIGAALIDYSTATTATQAVYVQGGTYMSGAAPKLFDGQSLTELGFYFYPDSPVALRTNGSTGLSAGTYTYAVLYAWYDATGKLWRSPAVLGLLGNKQPVGANSVTITCNAGDTVSLTNLTYLQGSAKQNVFIEVYRTLVNGVQLFKIAEIPNVSTLGALSTAYYDSLPDASVNGEVMYTDGSAPTYLAPPATSYLAATPNRIYGIMSETQEVWVSNVAGQTTPPQFVLGQTIGLPTLQYRPSALAIMDGSLFILAPSDVLVTNADGTYLSATQSVQFVPPRRMPFDAGCTTPGSVIATEMGIFYQSYRGLVLLNRSHGTTYIGESVNNFQDPIQSAQVLPSLQQIRFVTTPRVLVYDYVHNRWSIYTGQTAVDGCTWQGNAVIVQANGVVKVEGNGFLDDGVTYPMRVVTPWIKPSGINGYGRCWRFVVLGEGRSNHTLQVRIAYQYDETFVDTIQIPAANRNPNGIYGQSLGTYGATKAGVFGALPVANAYQFEAVMPRQKAGAFKFEISDMLDVGTGEGLALTMLSLDCGIHEGLARLPAGKRGG